MLPQAAIELVQRWANDKTPEEYRDRMRVDVEQHPRGLTIVECSLMPGLDGEMEWLRVPSARLGYSSGKGQWTLYCFNSNSKALRYPFILPTKRIQHLLDEIDDDPTCIFWG